VGGSRAAEYALSLSEEINHQLALFREVVPLHLVQTGGSGEVRPDYTIDGSVRGEDVNLRVTVSLVEAGTGAVLWTQSFETDESARGDDLIRTQVEMASTTASARPRPTSATSRRPKPLSTRPVRW
jgi:TolB-like protein